MAHAEVVRLVIYDNVLFQYGGKVDRWARGLERRFTRNAREMAPVNKRSSKSTWRHLAPYAYRGALKEGISGSAQKVGLKRWNTTISSSAPYSLYVLRGTSGPITATSGSFMWLPVNPGFGTKQKIRSVSGQRPNNFFQRAADATAAMHPSIRGMANTLEL